MTEKNDNGPTEAALLACFDNHSDNIEYTKTRSAALVVGYSAVVGFLYSNQENVWCSGELIKTSVLLVVGLLLLACWIMIWKNYEDIERRREKLKELHKRLNTGYKLPIKRDYWILFAQILYLATAFLFLWSSYIVQKCV